MIRLLILLPVKTQTKSYNQHLKPKNVQGGSQDKVSRPEKRLTGEEEIILIKCCLAIVKSYGQAEKLTEWWAQIRETFHEEAGRAYIGVQRKMEQLVKDKEMS